MCDVNCSKENPLGHGPNVLLNIFHEMEFNSPLYYFTLPGFTLVAVGLYIHLNQVQTFYPDGSFNLETAVLMLLLTFIGIFMAFTGILLHSIAGLIRYKMNNP
ncbi:hypothetical protein EO95_00395 [Methanosarcina sp. 1.H.T.1A.1]|nr:hypothetical protein EO95_00395 [Methanosarcina sp. 1.H.T.1A.1]